MMGCVKLCVLPECVWYICTWQKRCDYVWMLCVREKMVWQKFYQVFSWQIRRFEFNWTEFTALRGWCIWCWLYKWWLWSKTTRFVWIFASNWLWCTAWWPDSYSNSNLWRKKNKNISLYYLHQDYYEKRHALISVHKRYELILHLKRKRSFL